MPQRSSPLLPATERRLSALGERIRLARLRRKITAAHLAGRAGMSPMTLRGIERGTPGATLGAYAAVLQVLGLDADLDTLAAQDPLGRDLQDSRLRPASRVRRTAVQTMAEPAPEYAKRGVSGKPPATPSPAGMASEDLARLITAAEPRRKKPAR